jgi:hypothetical protein
MVLDVRTCYVLLYLQCTAVLCVCLLCAAAMLIEGVYAWLWVGELVRPHTVCTQILVSMVELLCFELPSSCAYGTVKLNA